MIKVEEIHSLNGDAVFNTNDIITLTPEGIIKTADGRIITLTMGGGTTTPPVDGGGTTTPPVENKPVAKNDTGSLTEDDAITQLTGNVLTGIGSATADIIGDNGPLVLTGIEIGLTTTNSTSNINQILNGTYGNIIIDATGNYTYNLDNTNNETENLITGQTVTDNFTYTIKDVKGNYSRANIIISINGANDNRPSITIINVNGAEAGNFSINDLQTLMAANFTINSITPLDTLSINSVLLTLVMLQESPNTNITVNTPKGILTIVNYNLITGLVTFNYKPTVSMNTLDNIALEATDTNGFKSSTTLGINITHIELVETEDSLIEFLDTTIDNLQNNTVEIIQEANQPGWNKFQPIVIQKDFSLVTSSSNSMSVKKIKFNVRSAGYQLIKILLYELNSSTPISFTRIDTKSLSLTSEPTNILNIVQNGFMLVDNSNYELANIFNTSKMPIATASGWYSLTAVTEATASFEATFTVPKELGSIKIYRCGTTNLTFNGGADPYDVQVIDNAGIIKNFEVPKLNDSAFTNIANFVSGDLSADPIVLLPEDKKYNFNLSYSYDNINFTNEIPIEQNPVKNITTNLWTYTNNYSITTIPNIDQRKLYIKIPDTDIPFLKNLKIKTWYLL